MVDEIKRRVFEPFFTTKEEERDGLGLSVPYGIISRHNGEITMESHPGEGTTVTVALPGTCESKLETDKPVRSVKESEVCEPSS
jgi:signal transduction histidine kinase